MKSKILIFFVGCTTATLFLWGYLHWKSPMPHIHRLTTPLQLRTKDVSNGLLPLGTTLYYDTSLAEGISRYKIYVNIDRMPLPLEALQDPTKIAPIEAAPFTQSALLRLLNNHPITRDDLRAIVNSGYLSKEEIQEVLYEFTKGK
jgi:hypothetical protein